MASAKPKHYFVYASEIKRNCIFIQLRGMLIVTLFILCFVRDVILRDNLFCCEAWTHSLLFKSKETFKLAEIQNLEASMQIECSEHLTDDIEPSIVIRFNLTRLVVDRATGSSLFRLDLQSRGSTEDSFSNVASIGNSRPSPLTENFLRSHVLSLSCLQRCDWVGQVVVEGDNSEDLVKNLREQDFLISPNHYDFDVEDWNLDYVKLAGEVEPKKKPMHTMKSFLCSVAREMPSRPSLIPALARSHFVLVDSAAKDFDSCFLIQCIDKSPDIKSMSSLQHKWAKRPFQYSSAINFELAEMVLEILMTLCNEGSHFDDDSRDTKGVLLDPTCGSGTFLALALANGFHIEGYDINPTAVEGALRNLEYFFEDDIEKVKHRATVKTHDSCNPSRKKKSSSSIENNHISCVVANLPWGRNSILYIEENERILRSIRSQIHRDTPCAFITRPSDSGEDEGPSLLFESTGFHVLGQAFVPQRNFLLPTGKKQRKKLSSKNSRNKSSGFSRKQNQCVVTIARAKHCDFDLQILNSSETF